MKSKAFDSTLAFYVNQLDKLDTRLNEPLFDVTWGRDIKLRSDVTFANVSSSFTRSTFGGIGTMNAGANDGAAGSGGLPWISQNTTTLPGVSVDGEMVTLPIRLCGREISYTSVELERSQLLGQPIDAQKTDAMNSMYQMGTDQMVYIGDSTIGQQGLLNNSLVSAGNVANGAAASPLWSLKTPDEIVKDINDGLTAAWTASGFKYMPTDLLLPPIKFAYLVGTKVSSAGNMSLLEYVKQNSMSNAVNGTPLNIRPSKWATGRGAGGTDRMLFYRNQENLVRFVMVPIRRETPYYLGIKFNAPYIWAYGGMEMVYPETLLYRDGF